MPSRRGVAGPAIDQGSARKIPRLVYVGVFLLAGAAAYWWESSADGPVEAGTSTATARVHICESPKLPWTTEEPPGRPFPQQVGEPAPHPDLDAIGQRIVALANDREPGSLQVEAIPSSTGNYAIAVTATGATPEYAAETANLAAESFAEAYRHQWKSISDQTHQAARESANRAERDFRQAQSQFEAYHGRLARAEEEAVRKREAARKRQAALATQPPPPLQPTKIQNPEWAELNRHLGMLRQQRTELLVKRTPLHPEVLDVEARIQQVEQQFKAIPPSIPAAPPAAPPAPPSPTPPSVVEQPETVEVDRAELQRLSHAVAQAEHEKTKAAAAELAASQRRQQLPAIEVEHAQPQPPAQTGRPPSWQLLVALVTGLTAAAGVAMTTTGLAIEPALRSVAEVEAAIGVPVVGTIPQVNPKKDFGCSPWQRLLRAAWVAGGLALLAGCLVTLLVMHKV